MTVSRFHTRFGKEVMQSPAPMPEFSATTQCRRKAALWVVLLLAICSVACGQVVINEIHYNPPDQGIEDGLFREFIELYNPGNAAVDLTGYFFDSGLLCALLDIQSPAQLDSHYLRGNIFESFIVAEHIKSRLHAGRRPNAFFWRNSTGHEVDLILEADAQLFAVEIKSGETLNEDFFKGLRYFKRLSSAPDEHFYLVYGGNRNLSRKYGQVVGWKSISKLP